MKFVLFYVKSTFFRYTYSEIFDDKRVVFYKEINNNLLNTLRNIHTSIKLNQYFTMPFQKIWVHTFFDENSILSNEECIFLFEEGNKQAYNQNYLHYIRKKYQNAKLYFLFWNPVEYLQKKYVNFINTHYDKILSFDPEDCKKYNWVHYSGIYSKPQNNIENLNPKFDILFIGHNKGRLKKLHFLYKKFTEAGLKCDFYISEVEKKDNLIKGIHYNKYLDYIDVINHVKNSKAILEILQEHQHGSTLRPMEAMVYQKILITDNKDVKKERYYSKEQFYIFDDVMNIDIQEIKNKLKTRDRLSYNGNLSPKKFLDFLETLYNS